MRNDYPPIAVAFGANVKRLREAHEFTQGDLAARLRDAGLDLSRSALAAIERGSGRTLDLAELAILCGVLESNLDDLLAGDGMVRSSASATTSLDTIRRVLAGDRVGLEATVRQLLTSGADAERRYREVWPKATVAGLIRAERASKGEVETKAARRLGVSPAILSVAAFAKWDHSLTAERDERTPAGQVSAQARGRITRQLLEELGPKLRGV